MPPVLVFFLILLSLLCAVAPAALFLVNLRLYRPPRQAVTSGEAFTAGARVAVLIPARDEERNIEACLAGVLASRGVDLEVVVLDDASTDATAALVRQRAQQDGRLKLVRSGALPAGWNGKQHACWRLAQETDAPVLLFLDADVRLAADAVARCLAQRHSARAALLSGFPRQITLGWMEKMLLPLIHFVLLGFLPLRQMRRTVNPAFAAGCGQFLMVEREAYLVSGGHAAIRETRHDGLRLPQLLRRHGYRTELVDLTGLAEVRMYDSAGAVWTGLAKNATEGLGAPARIVPFTVLLGLGQIVPVLLAGGWMVQAAHRLAAGAGFPQSLRAAVEGGAIALALVASYLPRVLAVRRFRQSRLSALLHPLGVFLLLLVQWYALSRQLRGKPVAWRARRYSTKTGVQQDGR